MPPRIALVMPFLNEERNLPAVLASLSRQRIDHARLRVIAVDNGSHDQGPALVRAWLSAGDIDGSIVTATVRSIPHALNCGFAATHDDEIVVRLDAHTTYGERYLEAIDAALARLPPEVWCVGAAPSPGVQATFGLALHAALFTNPVGLGPAPFRTGTHELEVDHVYLGAWRPGVVARVGGYDERWIANEDAEFSERLRALGGRIVRIALDADLILTRGPLAAISQWHRYGTWRARTIRRHRSALRARHLAPPLALVTGTALAVSSRRRWLLPLVVLYAAAIVRNRRRGESPAVTTASIPFFIAVQIAYALGLVRGAMTPVRDASVQDRGDDARYLKRT